jgi:hypothetical protein
MNLKMGKTSVPETLVIHQNLTPGYNPKTFKQHCDLQLHIDIRLRRIFGPMGNEVGQQVDGVDDRMRRYATFTRH